MKTLKLSMLVVLVLLSTGCASTRLARPEPPTLDEIVEMSRASVPAEEIIKRIKESRGVYPLTASEIASLHDRGVPDAVLDYMHKVHLREVREDEAAHSYYRHGWFYHPYFYYGYPRGRWHGGVRFGW